FIILFSNILTHTVSSMMTDVEPVVTDFAATGRTGRRNAMPDILGSTAGPGAADLPNKLAELSVGAQDSLRIPSR
uniref:Protein kinase (cAMP-dependent, catalytic) inhibitor beta n=1 Tax=Electrophorus electricus TaxID=8005 RepID=A0A4W4GHD6_ELEEL